MSPLRSLMPSIRSPLHLAAALLATGLAACGGGGGGGSVTPVEPPPAANNPAAIAASKPGELLAVVKATLAARQAQGWTANNAAALGGDAMLAALPATASGAVVERSNTAVQEAGIDEDDLIKSDGQLIHSIDNSGRFVKGGVQSMLKLHQRAADGRVTLLQSLALPQDASTYPNTRGLLLTADGKRLAVLGDSTTVIGLPSPCPPGAFCIATSSLVYWPSAVQRETQVQAVELSGSGAATASLGTRLSISGQVVGSRLVGSTLVLVTTYLPTLPVDVLPASATPAERDAALAKLTAADVLPTLRVNDGKAQPLVVDTDCHLQPKNASLNLQVTTITAIDLSAPALPRSSRCFLGGTEAIYLSPASNLYLATSRSISTLANGSLIFPSQASTDIHKFSVNGQAIAYRGSGEVSGHLGWDAERRPYRMSEHNGDLRVISFTGETGWAMAADAANPKLAPSPATLTVLRERASDQSLQVLARLPNAQRPAALGHAGEQVYAVRFVGDRGYLVTFRRTDPLYVLDLANSADPQQAGELQMPGFSDYLFPLSNGLLLGVGRDADASGRVGGVKIALMDVADPKNPKALDSQTLPANSATALDSSSHGINLFNQGSTVRVALPTTVATQGGLWQQGLYRWEVDTLARTLAAKPPLGSTAADYADLSQQRALQFAAQVVWLRDGQLSAWDW